MNRLGRLADQVTMMTTLPEAAHAEAH
eukprot:COSAG03_NODE_10727_length_632_cov_3.038304_1_plen_26_part_01